MSSRGLKGVDPSYADLSGVDLSTSHGQMLARDGESSIGVLASPLGFSKAAGRRAAASDIRLFVLSIDEALEMHWRPIARELFPWDWAFHPDLAAGLYRLHRKDAPRDVIEAIEPVPFEEWQCFVTYGLANHRSEAADLLWFIALHHHDDGWRFNAVRRLIDSGLLDKFNIDELLSKEKDPETVNLIRRSGLTNQGLQQSGG